MFTCGFREILPKTNFDSHENVTLAQKETKERLRKKKDDQSKILRTLPFIFVAFKADFFQ